jgi:hypothetical protein
MKITGPRESVAYFKQDDITKISGSFQTSLRSGTGPVAQLKYTGPRVSVAYDNTDSPQTSLWSETGPIAQEKLTFEAPSVSGSYQTSLKGGTDSATYMKITGPKESVGYFKQDSPQTGVWRGTVSVPHLKYTFEAPVVSGSFQTSLPGATQNGVVAQDITKISGSFQTTLSGASGPVAQLKIGAPKESVAYWKIGSPQTAVWGASGSVAQMKITGPDVNHQTSLSATTDSFNFG